MRVMHGLLVATLALGLISPVAARGAHHHRHHHDMMVAYDAKDRTYYPVRWARAHGMHDRGGDPLVIRRLFSLPRSAGPSRVMRRQMM
ncbi:MAG: hypothetical protein JO250_20970 [Armatimonadetes bacterium]|nr:hypothetical protein [Armatimonadota bacterium]